MISLFKATIIRNYDLGLHKNPAKIGLPGSNLTEKKDIELQFTRVRQNNFQRPTTRPEPGIIQPAHDSNPK